MSEACACLAIDLPLTRRLRKGPFGVQEAAEPEGDPQGTTIKSLASLAVQRAATALQPPPATPAIKTIPHPESIHRVDPFGVPSK